jgi:hypothetical protein
VQLAPRTSEYHDWLGKAYGRQAERSMFLSAMSWARKTHKEFEVAVQLNPNNFEAQRDLIRYEMNAPGMVGGGDDKALKHIEDLEKLDSLQGQLARGEFLTTKKDLEKADAVFAKLLPRPPQCQKNGRGHRRRGKDRRRRPPVEILPGHPPGATGKQAEPGGTPFEVLSGHSAQQFRSSAARFGAGVAREALRIAETVFRSGAAISHLPLS